MSYGKTADGIILYRNWWKKSGGLGKYRYNEGQIPEQLLECLQKKSDRYMLLSVALPADEELENAMENASYLLEKRSGFVES